MCQCPAIAARQASINPQPSSPRVSRLLPGPQGRLNHPSTGEPTKEATENPETQRIYRRRRHRRHRPPRVICKCRPRRLNRGGIVCQ